MQGTLLVTPEELISASGEFASTSNAVQQTSTEMQNIVANLGTSYLGEASQAFSSKFKALDEDMGQMFRMIKEHSDDLAEMARNYQAAEQAASEGYNALNTNAIS